MQRRPAETTSWEESEKWYDQIVGTSGHYYHSHIIFPNLLRLLELEKSKEASLLDLGCGQGVFSRALPKNIAYTGVDLSKSLIQKAKAQNKHPHHDFLIADITKPLPLKRSFTHACMILSLQNVERADLAILEASKHLDPQATLVIVLNHPCFRIPRQTHWIIDEKQKIQSRRIDRYMTPLKIPISTHPGKGEASVQTFSFHHNLSDYSAALHDAGLSITLLEEWVSDKKSSGKHAKMEDRARQEFPLFLALQARKQ